MSGGRDVASGHVYTLWPLSSAAYCKNSIDGQWYCFDDSEVSPVADEDVCQQTAYILFYQRRTAVPSWSANSSLAGQSPPVPPPIPPPGRGCILVLLCAAGSTSSSLCDHWINRLPGSRAASLASGASSRRTSLASLAESVEFPPERSEDDGNDSSPFCSCYLPGIERKRPRLKASAILLFQADSLSVLL